MLSIGKNAALNRLGRELADDLLAQCKRCGYEKEHTFHMPQSMCEHCLAPQDHHKYQPWERSEEL
jgi:ribosomal protein L37E